jgi:exosortase
MMLPSPARSRQLLLGAALGSLLALVWSYWTTLAEMAQTWSREPQYSHGFLVPMFAGVLLWLRRERFRPDDFQPGWWGLPLVAVAVVLRLYGTWYHYTYFDAVSFVLCLAGVWLMVGGLPAWRWAWPAVLFLLFMVPLPDRVNIALSVPLQTVATESSTWVLQTIGLPAVSEGNVIRINDSLIGIVEACSGLRMLVVFFALSTGMALVIKAPLGDKLVLVVSSVPIALLVNIIRITLTGALSEMVSSQVAHVFFHDVAGWLMPPLALGFLWLEWKALGKLLIEVPHAGRGVPKGRKVTAPAPAAPKRRPRPTRPATAPRSSQPASTGEAPAPRLPVRPRRPAAPPPPAAPSEPAASASQQETPQTEHASTHGASA